LEDLHEPEGAVKCNYPALIKVRLVDAKAKAVEGAAVELVLTMVNMDYGYSRLPPR
jgi:hypothetical protein